MNTTDKRTIEVEVTAEDLEKLKADGVAEKDLPEIGVKRYRPARHIQTGKNTITLLIDAEVLEHFEKRAGRKNAVPFQIQINDELRSIMERDRAEEESANKGNLAA